MVIKSLLMSEAEEVGKQPSLLARTIAHVGIGLLVTAVTKTIFRQKLTVAIVAGFVAFALHENFDVPIAQKLSELGL